MGYNLILKGENIFKCTIINYTFRGELQLVLTCF